MFLTSDYRKFDGPKCHNYKPSGMKRPSVSSRLATNLLTVKGNSVRTGVIRVVLCTVCLLFFQNSFGEDQCVSESIRFADCVDATIVEHAPTGKTRAQLTEQVVKSCTAERKTYESCGQFDKAAYSADFIKVRVELFTKEHGRAFAGVAHRQDPGTD